MTKVPDRPLSYGEIKYNQEVHTKFNNSFEADKRKLGITHSKLPNPFKCAKCKYIAAGKADFNEHCSLEHD